MSLFFIFLHKHIYNGRDNKIKRNLKLKLTHIKHILRLRKTLLWYLSFNDDDDDNSNNNNNNDNNNYFDNNNNHNNNNNNNNKNNKNYTEAKLMIYTNY